MPGGYTMGMSKPVCLVQYLGRMDYQQAWDLQAVLADEIASGERSATLLLLEHPHTYTFGRRGQSENLLWDEAELARREVSIHWVDRGGDVTYHGPGQLVGYPLISLNTPASQVKGDSAHLPQADYVGYVRRLEEVLIATLARFGVAGIQVQGLTGVWVNLSAPLNSQSSLRLSEGRMPASALKTHLAKIAAIGVKVDARGITRHGFALNVQPDMSYWEGIIGCGLEDYPITSLSEIIQPVPTMDQVARTVSAIFGSVFQFDMLEEQ